jgi:signal transduction histidine kinase
MMTPRANGQDAQARNARGTARMRHGWDGFDERDEDGYEYEPRRRHAHGQRRRRGSKKRKETEEERVYRQARLAAAARVGFLTHLTSYGAVCLFLLFVAGFRTAFTVAFFWGIGIAAHYFAAILGPELRRRFVAREVESQLAHNAPRERQNLETKHVRSLEELSASIAHEIRNPITAAKSLVQQMGEDPASNENVDYAKVAIEELDRVERSVAHLLRYAREEDVRMVEFVMGEVVESALETFRERIRNSAVDLRFDVGRHERLRGDPEQLRRVLINLFGNALDALEDSNVREPRLQITSGENLAGTECWVRVADNGPGIDPETLGKIFSPFYTSKQRGTGLGLALSKKVVDAHGGSIEAHSAPGEGATFTITIPKHAERA